MTVGQASKVFGIPERTLRRWCDEGTISAIAVPYGSKVTYRLTKESLEAYLTPLESLKVETSVPAAESSSKDHKTYLAPWKRAMLGGVMTGRPFSLDTVSQYVAYATKHLERFERLTVQSLKTALLETPVEQFGRKDKFYKAMVCFAKFLAEEGAFEASRIEEMDKYRPIRHKPPKLITVTEDQLVRLVSVCKTPMEKALVILLAATGLRASECAMLTLADLDMEKKVLTVRCGKGGKMRRVGLCQTAHEVLAQYLLARAEAQPRSTNLFFNTLGLPIDRHGIRKRLERLGKLAGVDVTPHALRRAFVTINANKGRSLVMLQIACGHSSINTTRGYCRTTEQDLLLAMLKWD